MTRRDEIIRLIELAKHFDQRGEDFWPTIEHVLQEARALDPIEELRLKLAEDLVDARKIFPQAVLCFEVTLANGRTDVTYSIGRESRDQFAVTVDGRGATLAQAIANARQLPLPRGGR